MEVRIPKVNIQTKLKIYKSIVKPVLTYNFATLALTTNVSKELDCIHRTQLRHVWNDKKIHNKQLYEKSREKPLSAEMKEARWRKLGHILRLPTSTPSQQSMNYYFEYQKQRNSAEEKESPCLYCWTTTSKKPQNTINDCK